MPYPRNQTYTAFHASKLVASGKLSHVAVVLHGLLQRNQGALPLIFDDETGRQVELDLRGFRSGGANLPADAAAIVELGA